MLSERDIELAHPEAFDFVFGNLRPDKQAEFDRHLPGCRHCQSVVDEYSEIGGVIKLIPPHIKPRANLEERTVAAMVAAMTGEGTTTEAGAETQPPPVPAHPDVRPMVTRRPAWRRYRWRLAAAVAAAAAIIVAAIVVPLSLGRGPAAPAQATVVIPLHATAAAKVFGIGTAAGQATARQAGDSWTFDLNVHGLRPLPDGEVYVCWWAGPGSTKAHPLLVTGGSFVVGESGSTSLTMTTGVDPRQFTTMEITAEAPGDGAAHGAVLLIGRPATT
jgi:hypothetical protein